jgi:outer membrane protein assembly factor BamB
LLICVIFYSHILNSIAIAFDQPQWGQKYSRNMVSSETGLPETFDPATGKNIKWVVPLGTQTYSTPVIGNGKILIGTNNDKPRDPRHKGDRGILLCLDESDGSFCWQLVVPKLGKDPYIDWPRVGMCSSATIEGDRAYILSNKGEVICLDLNGQANGNDGPYRDEGRHMTPSDEGPMEVADTDADIIWLFDLIGKVGVHVHDSAHSSILIYGNFLYVNTSNGLNSNHTGVHSPDAPSLIVLDKTTGRLAARENENISPRIFHCTWSSPALGEVNPVRDPTEEVSNGVNGQTLVFFCGGDGVCYAFEALESAPSSKKLKNIWRFDCDPNAPKENIHEYIGNRRVSPSNIKSMPVFYNNRVYVTVGGDIWWGKHQAWLKCIDATKTGDITDSGQIWSYDLQRHCCSTPSIYNDLVFVADCGQYIHCVDAKTGKAYWSHDMKGEIWGSTLVADGKVYVGTRRGDFWVLAASKDKQIISSIELDSPTTSTPVAANGVLYVATMKKLYALKKSTE